MSLDAALVLAFWTPGPIELVFVLIIALLLFGKRLPEVARNLGKGVVEFKKGVRGVEGEISRIDHDAEATADRAPASRTPAALTPLVTGEGRDVRA